jgi:F420 biosynthesis protein FbiB-like protein
VIADFLELARTRRSIRRYQSRPVETALLEHLLEAANWAPSAHNRQPWRFCVVTDANAKADLSQAMAAQWRQDLQADQTDPALIERRVTISQLRLTSAAALIVAALSMEQMDVYADEQRNHAEWVMAVQSVALACQNLLLAAHAFGLAACWMCAPLFAPKIVCSVLQLPLDWQPQAFITVGYPAEVKTKERASIASRIIWR